MDLIELVPRLHFLRFPVGHCYLWRDPDGLTLIDTSTPGSGPLIASAIRALGHQPADLRRLVLTHFHPDHAGSAAEIAAWGEVTVCAHRADVPFIQGQAAGPPPDITASERPLFERIQAQAPPAPVAPVGVDRALDDGDDLGFGDGALVVAVPGHTPGSVAVYLPSARVLFTGDTVARAGSGHVILGPFNTDPAQAAASFSRLAALGAEIACFGHGEPLSQDTAAQLRGAAARLSPP